MAWVLVPIRGEFDGGEETAAGQPLDLPWDGCELSELADLPSLYAAVATAEAKDWLIGVRAPLLAGEAVPDLAALVQGDAAARQQAQRQLEESLHRARSVAARYLTLPLPPSLLPDQHSALWEAIQAAQGRVGVEVVVAVATTGAGAGPAGSARVAVSPGDLPPGIHPGADLTPGVPRNLEDAGGPLWAFYLRLPARELDPSGGAAAGWLPEWALRHRQGRLILEPDPVVPAGWAAVVTHARLLLGR